MTLDPVNDVERIPLGDQFRRSPRRRDRIKDEEAKHEKWLRIHVPGMMKVVASCVSRQTTLQVTRSVNDLLTAGMPMSYTRYGEADVSAVLNTYVTLCNAKSHIKDVAL